MSFQPQAAISSGYYLDGSDVLGQLLNGVLISVDHVDVQEARDKHNDAVDSSVGGVGVPELNRVHSQLIQVEPAHKLVGDQLQERSWLCSWRRGEQEPKPKPLVHSYICWCIYNYTYIC